MTKEKEYVKNTIILLIGKFSTQLVLVVLIPLYTYKLTTANYGYIDLIQTYANLLAPVILLQIDSAIFRYMLDARNSKEEQCKIISSSFISVLIILLIASIVFFTIGCIFNIDCFWLIMFYVITTIINSYVISIARGKGNNKNYAIASIISSCVMLSINLILILMFNYDAKSILISVIFSNIAGTIFIFKKEKIYKQISLKYFQFKIVRKLLKYSIPMIPNVLSWWIVGLSDRTIIVNFINTAANGIYSTSCKFSNLLNSVFSIFSMSWHETASLHINDADAEKFFSKMIINICNLFLIISCGIIGLLPLLFNIIIGSEYWDSYNYIPILLTANMFNVFIGLLGGVYIAKKMTKKVAVTTVCSAVINVVVNLLLISKLGLYAACISTLVSYLLMAIYRYFDVKRIIKIKIYNTKSILYIIGYSSLIILYYLNCRYACTFLCILIGIFYCLDNKAMIKDLILNKYVKKIIKR